jgi:3D (Asp-Asp-Asp) domain-containing protein
MKEFNGNHLGVVITGGDKDPEGRGRTQIFIPNIMPALYELWNEQGEDISFEVIGEGLEGALNPEILKRLQQILPWAECAVPITGSSPSYKPSVLGQASEVLRNVGSAVVEAGRAALDAGKAALGIDQIPPGDKAGDLALSNAASKYAYASGKCGTAVGEILEGVYGYSESEIRAGSPDGRRDGKNYGAIMKAKGWQEVKINRPEDAPPGAVISYGAVAGNSYGHVEMVGADASGKKVYHFGLGAITTPAGGSGNAGRRNINGFTGVCYVPPPDVKARALQKLGVPTTNPSADPQASTTNMTPDPGTAGKNEEELASSYDQQLASTQSFGEQSSSLASGGTSTGPTGFGSFDGVSRPTTTSFKGNQNATPSPTPITTYSVGKSVGGTDETQDKWTNRGYTSTGRNLTPGTVAVDTKVYPLGTVFKDTNTGQVYIATDRHGNANPKVVDVYVPPSQYKAQSGSMNLAVVDTIPKNQIPKTNDGIKSLLSEYGEVPPGESAADFLTGKTEGVTDSLALGKSQPSIKNPTSHPGVAGPNTNNQALGMFGYASEGQAVWVFFREGNPLFPVYFAASYGQKEWQSMFGHASPGIGAGVTNPQADGKFPTAPTGAIPGTEASQWNSYGGGIRSASSTDESPLGTEFLFQLYGKNGSHFTFLKDHTEFYSPYDHVSRVMADHQDITEANKEVRVRGDYNTYAEQDLVISVGNWSQEAIDASDEIQKYITEAMKIKTEAGNS